MDMKLLAGAAGALLYSSLAFGQASETVGAGPEAQVPVTTPAAVWTRGPNVLFDNGPLINSIGTGVGGADESVLQTTSLSMTTLGFGHQLLNGNRVADDFTVPAAGWLIDSFTFFAYQTNSPTTSTMTAVNFRIWDGVPGAVGSNVIFGDTTTNRMTATAFTNIFRVTETTTGTTNNRPIMAQTAGNLALSLPAGTYWVDWQTDGSLASGPWAPSITINGSATTGNGLQSLDGAGAVYDVANDGGSLTQQGFPFVINGSLAQADVALGLSAGVPVGGLAVGDSFDYTLTGTNLGPGDASGLLFSLTLSNKVSFVSSDCGAVLNGNVVSFAVATLANGAITSCNITVAVVLGGDIQASATVSTTTQDPNLTNNSNSLALGFDPVAVPMLDRLGLLLAGLLLLGLGLAAIRRA